MANYCNYEMKVISSSKENLQEFFKRLKAGYNYNDKNYKFESKHYFRIFKASIVEDVDDEEYNRINNECWYIIVSGYCAWSVRVCMLPGFYSYYDSSEIERNDDDVDFYGTNLLLDSEELGLEIEVFSEEAGCGFMEHYIIRDGELEVDECVEYQEKYNEETDEYECIGGLNWDYNI